MSILSSDLVMLWSFPSGAEWLWIVLIAILLFGGKKIPELARGIGRGIREFNDAKDGMKKEIENGMNDKGTTNPSESSSKVSAEKITK